MLRLQPEQARRIVAAPAFRELSSARAKLRWGLSFLTLFTFFGFLALVSTAKEALGSPVAGSIVPIGLVLLLAISTLVVVLTGIYVRRSNSRFDELAHALKQEFGQ
jgi:uncharacterized membrane protein (DUF485 family)